MMKINKLFYFPAILISIYTILYIFRVPTLGDSIIFFTLGLLYGITFYFNEKIKDRPIQVTKDPEIEVLSKKLQLLRLNREVYLMEKEVAKQQQIKDNPNESKGFHF